MRFQSRGREPIHGTPQLAPQEDRVLGGCSAILGRVRLSPVTWDGGILPVGDRVSCSVAFFPIYLVLSPQEGKAF